MDSFAKYITDNNYFGLRDGQYLGYNPSRRDIYIFHVFGDGSHAIMIKDNHHKEAYIFGSLQHVKYLIKQGYFNFADYFLTKEFIIAIQSV